MAEALAQRGVALRGFFTEEVLGAGGSRVGFDVVTVPDGRRGVLSRKAWTTRDCPRSPEITRGGGE